MLRIKLIVTGDMEKRGLHESLRRFFPSERDSHSVTWDMPRKVACATSHRLKPGNPPSTPMKTLVDAMFAEAITGKEGHPADLVVVIDDVELGNLGQEDIVADHFRAAVQSKLNSYSSTATAERYRVQLREKCSFHLLKPMVESYLFSDQGALEQAGVAASTTPQLAHPTDVEAFESNDPVWLPTCFAENARRQSNTPWWRHERHPKHYLTHLAERTDPNFCYDETRHGVKALNTINWQQTVKKPTDAAILCALFQDLADWFGVTNPLGTCSPSPHFYPTVSTVRANMLLRNL